jgi:putative transposase
MQRTGTKSTEHAPTGTLVKRMARVKLYPNHSQEAALGKALDICRQLYNAALEQRRDAWRTRRLSLTHYQQYTQLTELRQSDPRIASIYRELLDAALWKLDLAFAAFFRRTRRGEKPGFPRFRSRARYNCLEFPHGNRALTLSPTQRKVRVPGVGLVRLRKGRNIGVFGRAMIVRNARGWFALFECGRETKPQSPTGRRVGLDRGITTFAATSDGDRLTHPRLANRNQAQVARLARVVARRSRGGANRRKAVKMLARRHDRLRWARRDFLHKLTRSIVDSFDFVAIEALKVRNMMSSAKGTTQRPGSNVRAKARLNFAIADAGWTLFASMLHAKAEEAGRTVFEVDPHYTSQTCSGCGWVDAASRISRAVFICTHCGSHLDADVNAAKVILKRAELAACGEGRRVAGPQRSTKRTSAGADPVNAAPAA